MPALPPSVTTVLDSLKEAHLPLEQHKLKTVIDTAAKIYKNEPHFTGMTLLEHALGVLQILLPFQPDAETVIACILQHAIFTKALTSGEIEEEFGPRVRKLVSSVHLLSRVSLHTRTSIEDLRLMLLRIADDISIILIILCRHCFLLEHPAKLSASDRKRYARDALNLSAPVAARLGIHTLKQRLENLAFPVLYPADAERISEQLEQVHARHGVFIRAAAALLRTGLAEQGIISTVQGREKQAYSMFMKMKSKSLSHIESLPDLFALRVIVESEEDCYRVLGALHRIGRPVANRFKDYIAFPKPNGYQSLHTTVARLPGVPEGLFIEVQVRTLAMHREAEYGIAAHWSYKEGGSAQQTIQRVQLQQALESQHSLGGLSAGTRLADHIFVLTPKGDIIELPEGATPLDFAFQIHTDLGLSFRAARVNGSVVPLDYELENGDVVDIVTSRTPSPSSDWLQLLKMASSRSRLKRYLNTFTREKDVAHGKDIVNEELRRRRLPPLDTALSLLRLCDGKKLTLSEREDLLMKLGQGSDKVGPLFLRLDLITSLPKVAPPAAAPKKKIRFQRKDALIDIEGDVPMPLKFAKCCKPQENAHGKLTGIITRSGDVMVHVAKCRNANRGNPERRISVWWRK